MRRGSDPAIVDCASHPPSRSFGVAGSEAVTGAMGEAVASPEGAVLAWFWFLVASAMAILWQ